MKKGIIFGTVGCVTAAIAGVVFFLFCNKRTIA